MILQGPVTGKLISYDPKTKIGVGSNDNPVRPLDFNKLLPKECDFKWTAVSYDYEGGMVIIEITFTKKITVTEWDNAKTPPEQLAWRTETDAEFYKRQMETEKILWDIFKKPVDELYKLTGQPRVEKPEELS